MGRAKVGQSGVTPCKHFLLNALLGQEAGVIGRGNLPQCDSAYWVDLTAGDGAATQVAEPEKSCSPAIFARHCAFVAKHGKPIQAHLYERASTNYSKLVDALDTVWLEQYPDAKGSLFTHNVDSSNLQLDLGSRTACFLYNDPNSIDDWAFTREFLTSARPTPGRLQQWVAMLVGLSVCSAIHLSVVTCGGATLKCCFNFSGTISCCLL